MHKKLHQSMSVLGRLQALQRTTIRNSRVALEVILTTAELFALLIVAIFF